MNMRIFIPALILTGCGVAATEEAELDPTPVSESVRAVQPGPLLDLVHRTEAVVGVDGDCPRIVALSTDTGVLHERWLGECSLEDGTRVTGSLERFHGPDSAWITGSDFR